jgi:hypothetical protein
LHGLREQLLEPRVRMQALQAGPGARIFRVERQRLPIGALGACDIALRAQCIAFGKMARQEQFTLPHERRAILRVFWVLLHCLFKARDALFRLAFVEQALAVVELAAGAGRKRDKQQRCQCWPCRFQLVLPIVSDCCSLSGRYVSSITLGLMSST